MLSLVRLVSPLVFLSLILAAGCRGGDDDGGDGDGDGDGDGGNTVYEVQDEATPVGTPVELRGVVVTAVDTFGARTGSIYVQEPDGGPFSGVLVFLGGTAAAGLVPGDIVDVIGGVKDEFALNDDMTGRTLTEVSPPQGGAITVTKVGDGEVPAPEVVLPQDLAASDDEAEKWEGVLIRFDNVRVFQPPRNVSSSDDTLTELDITGPFPVSSSLASLQALDEGDCLASLTGLGDYFFSYKLLPRSAADIVAGGDGCLDPEPAVDCADEIDNDLNGFADCADHGCQDAEETEEACTVTTSVVGIRDGTYKPEEGKASIAGAVVTAVNNNDFWIQDPGAAVPNSGIFVFQPGDEEGTIPAVGDVIDITGRTANAFGILQLGFVEFEVTDTGVEPTVFEADPADLRDNGATGEMFEGMLVTIPDVPVVSADEGFGQWSIGLAATKLLVDDFIVDILEDVTLANGDCLTSVAGVMHRNTFDDHPVLLPRDLDDVDATAGACDE
jgi:hypothetical protein